MMTDPSGISSARLQVACPSCDLLFDVSDLADGETARCSRCGHFLTRYRSDELSLVTAYTVSALIMMLLACSFPFLAFKSSGLESVMTLPQTAIALYENGMLDLALLVGGFIILIPALLLVLLLVLVLSMQLGRLDDWWRPIARLFFTLQNWSMAEVFFIGVLVSLVKIAKLATVVLGISFWAYAGFAILFTLAITTLDRLQCWRRIDAGGAQ